MSDDVLPSEAEIIRAQEQRIDELQRKIARLGNVEERLRRRVHDARSLTEENRLLKEENDRLRRRLGEPPQTAGPDGGIPDALQCVPQATLKDSDIKRIVDRYRALRLLDDPDDVVKRLSAHAADLRDAIEEINTLRELTEAMALALELMREEKKADVGK